MTDKLISLPDAAALVHSGDTLALGGMTLYRRPVAFVRELLKTETRDLTLLCFTASYESDLLVGAGRVKAVRTCYFGMEAFGLAPMFTQRATSGDLRVIEESEGSLAFGMRATLARVGFMPGPGWVGTDMLKVRPDVRVIDDPYTGKPVAAFPAIACDVAVDRELSMVARRVVVTAEEIVDELEAPVDVGQIFVTGVAHAPRGARPTSCYPLYPVDGAEILRYMEACTAGQFHAYLRGVVR